MIRRGARIAAELASAGLILLAALGGAAAWRLSQGPVSLAFLTPAIEGALAGAGLRVEIGDTLLTWGGDRVLALRARGVRALDAEGDEAASVPELGIGLDVPRLLAGELAPTRLELIRPRIRAVRDDDGAIDIDVFADEDRPPRDPDAPDVVAGLLEALNLPPGRGEGSFAELREVAVQGAELVLRDARSGRVWRAPRLDAVLRRDALGITGGAGLDVEVGAGTVRVSAGLAHRRAGQETVLDAEIEGLRPADVAARAPELARLSAVSLTLGGTARVVFGRGLVVREARFDLSGRDGAVDLPDLWPRPLPVASAALRGSLDAAARRLTVEEFRADLGGPVLVARASAVDDGRALDVEGEVRLEAVPIDALGDLWPVSVAPNPREWVLENLSVGTVDAASARLAARVPLDDPEATELAAFDADIRFRDVAVRYFQDLPRVTGVAGTARASASRMDLDLEGGRLRDLTLGRSTVSLLGLDSPDQQTIDIRIPISGPLRTVLQVIDTKPLGFPSKLGLKPASAGGQVEGVLTFAFPLLASLSVDDVAFGARAKLADVSLPGVVGDLPVTEGAGTLTLDPQRLGVEGTARLAGVPLAFTWRENFSRRAEFSTRIQARGEVGDADRPRLGLPDTAPWLTGPVGVEAVYLVPRPGQATLSADLALRGATLRAEPLGWEKRPGEDGKGRFELALQGGKPVRLPSFSLDAAGLRLRGQADLSPQWRPTRVVVEDLSHGASRFRADVQRAGTGPWRASVRGASADLRPIIGGKDEPGARTGQPSGRPAERPPPRKERGLGFPLELDLALGRVVLGDTREIHQVGGSLSHDGRLWTRVELDARVGEAPLAVRFVPDGAVRRLRVETEDAGAALRALDVFDTMKGGRLLVSGSAPVGDPEAPLEGSIELQGFSLTEAPVLARLLNSISPTGFAELLSSPDIRFDRLSGDWNWKDDRIRVRGVRTAGAALGLTADGLLDLEADTMDFEGTIVPVYGLNRVIGAIPLLGKLLTGGEGQGVFAFTYSVRGPMDDPRVAVNPLSVLTPGFLRNLFFLGAAPGDAPVSAPPSPPPDPGGN